VVFQDGVIAVVNGDYRGNGSKHGAADATERNGAEAMSAPAGTAGESRA
jgi:hypothetical protein